MNYHILDNVPNIGNFSRHSYLFYDKRTKYILRISKNKNTTQIWVQLFSNNNKIQYQHINAIHIYYKWIHLNLIIMNII